MRLRRPTLGLRWYFEHNDGHLMDKWDHYFDVYERHFGPFRGRKPKMLVYEHVCPPVVATAADIVRIHAG